MSSISNSLQRARLWWALGWLLVAIILVLSLMPSPPQPPVPISDKWQHTLAYTLLMSWFAQLAARRWLAALLLVAMGVGVEFIQGWSGLRYYEELDMVANSAGVVLGWVLYLIRIRYLYWFEQMTGK